MARIITTNHHFVALHYLLVYLKEVKPNMIALVQRRKAEYFILFGRGCWI